MAYKVIELNKLDEDRASQQCEKRDKLFTELDLTNKRPTLMKHNTRVHPPSEATKTSKAAIKIQSEAIRKCIAEYFIQMKILNSLIKKLKVERGSREG